jgi:hypothetical protein
MPYRDASGKQFATVRDGMGWATVNLPVGAVDDNIDRSAE